jgi:hypothetical protein
VALLAELLLSYVLTTGGRDLIAAVLTTQRVTLEQLQAVNA